MGSLVSGWDAPVVKFQRNKSYTRGEIEAFWRSQKEKEDGCSSADSTPRHSVQEEKEEEEKTSTPVRKYRRSNSLPLPARKNTLMEGKPKVAEEKEVQSTCWWTRSSWAFLNEQQIMETDETQSKHATKDCGKFFYNPSFGTNRQIIT